MTSVKWTLSIKWALSPLFSYSWTDSRVRQSKCWEKKKIRLLEYSMVQTLNSRGGRRCGTRGMAQKGEVEERKGWCHKASDLGSRAASHHQAAPHGQGSSASGSRRGFRINDNTTRAPVASVSSLWCTEIHHRTAPGWGESQPAILAAQGRVQTGNIMLSLTALQKEKLLWCLVTEFNRFQSVIIVQNHAWFVL